ncbi:methylated-DNA--[protein]-cysteine S-methyltransferase [uncultured Sphingomonas sp.]|uniref:methylated-DNA--[protein]-cysteine S-methyltransferase n=1 Tax=uncultured Sphingomonas sp. TaxID=158754 RepID=UPI0025D3712C|nr:methylated-DNA--[protein]-cysteine S-methyltransferase [uncultured Sphingomonas sp.]
MLLYATTMPSPVGTLTLVASDAGLTAVLWEDDRPGRVMLDATQAKPDHPILAAATLQLTDYFAGTRASFDLPLDPRGTPFQRRVWAALDTIPYGETRSYAQIAAQIGRPTAARAVGAANGRNPVSIVTPCHRVVGANGTLTGFAGGLAAKDYLLTLERGATAPSMPGPGSALGRKRGACRACARVS